MSMQQCRRMQQGVHLLDRIVAGVLLLLGPGQSNAQDIGPVSFRDSLVMRRVAILAPCPARVMIDRQTGGVVLGIIGTTETTGAIPSCVVPRR